MTVQDILSNSLLQDCNCNNPTGQSSGCIIHCMQKIEKFNSNKEKEENKEEQKKTILERTMPFLKMIMLAYAIYLSFRCKQKVDPLDLSMAIFFSPCYILYRLALIDNQCEVPLFDKQ